MKKFKTFRHKNSFVQRGVVALLATVVSLKQNKSNINTAKLHSKRQKRYNLFREGNLQNHFWYTEARQGNKFGRIWGFM